ncbi:DinB family protein [Neobacillus mesonae]|uniref:DinB family protein n=1 Tax=Neobacillus mesonae TaxID=1193713 RepID=UPI00082CABE8|nr:DinB family protein [Neobacillus mesonae]
MNIAGEYLKTIIQRFSESKKTAEKAIEQLAEGELFWSPNEESNSIAIIVKHMSGNMVSRWTDFFTTDGEKPSRNRDDEFVGDLQTKEQVMKLWELGWQTFLSALKDIREDHLLKTITIRNEPHTVIEAIERQMYHYSYHVGQIVYLAKMLKSSNWNTLTIPRKK